MPRRQQLSANPSTGRCRGAGRPSFQRYGGKPAVDEMPTINASGGFAPIEAYAWHKPLLERRGGEYDPRVRTRIERASAMTAVEYIRLRAARGDLIGRVAA